LVIFFVQNNNCTTLWRKSKRKNSQIKAAWSGGKEYVHKDVFQVHALSFDDTIAELPPSLLEKTGNVPYTKPYFLGETALSRDAIYTNIKDRMVSEFEVDGDVISPEKRLYDDLALDSLDAVDLLVSLKDHLKGNIDPALFKDARTVADLVTVLLPVWKTGTAE
jgi:acyl carrier protein